MPVTMTLARSQFLLPIATCLLSSIKTVRADWSPGGGPWGGENSDDGWSSHCGWWGGDCSDENNGSDGTNSSARLDFTASDINHFNRVITIHAVLACLVWVFLIPAGGILIRLGLKSPLIPRLHAIFQSVGYLVYVAAVACGIYLVRSLTFGEYSMWQDPHTGLGMALLVLGLFQPLLGTIHHTIYKRRAAVAQSGASHKQLGRTGPGYVHVWLGRILIVLGMVNGALGLRLAGQSRYSTNRWSKGIGYGVGAGFMFVLYVVFVILGESRRSKESRRLQDDTRRNGIPMVRQDELHPPVYHHPPSYQASQDSMVKANQTTARYG